MKIILGSASPRRQQMLRDLGIRFETIPANVPEEKTKSEKPLSYVLRLAKDKALAVASRQKIDGNWAVLTADTIVISGKTVLEKPREPEDAVRMLKKLSGKTHEVITAWCWTGAIGKRKKTVTGFCRTKVTFERNSSDFWRWYVTTGEPMDKAGAYAAQGVGMSFIKKVNGSYSNVVGLPLSDVLESFRKTFGKDLRHVTR